MANGLMPAVIQNVRRTWARRVRNEDIRVRNAEHDIEELSVNRTDSIVVVVVHHWNASNRTVSERTEPAPAFGLVVVFPVRSEHAGVIEGVGTNDRFADEMRVARDFEAVETVMDFAGGAHFGLEIEVVSAVLTEQVDSVVEIVRSAVHHLFEQGSAFFTGIVREVSTTEKVHFGVDLERMRFEFHRSKAVAGVLRNGNDGTQRKNSDKQRELHLELDLSSLLTR